MSGAMGAYATSNQTIYINNAWVQTASNIEAIKVLTEEYGHHLDALLNDTDTPGDEGQYFAELLISPSKAKSTANQADDNGLILIDGKPINVEFASTKILDANYQQLDFDVNNRVLGPVAGRNLGINEDLLYGDVINIGGESVDALYTITSISSNISVDYADVNRVNASWISMDFRSSAPGTESITAEISFYEANTYTGPGTGNKVTLENIVVNTYDIDIYQ